MNIRDYLTGLLHKDGYLDIDFSRPIKKQIDSLDMTALIITVEDDLKVSISDEERWSCKTFNDLVTLLQSKVISTDKFSTEEQIQWLDKLHFESDEDMRMVRDIKENLIAVRMMENTGGQVKHQFTLDLYTMNTLPTCAVCGQSEYSFNHYHG